MPQLDFHTFPTQIFWLVVSFVLLYLLMRVVALPRIEKIVEERRRRLDEDLEKAYDLYRNEEIRGAKKRYWEDVKEGEALPRMARWLTTQSSDAASVQPIPARAAIAMNNTWSTTKAIPRYTSTNRTLEERMIELEER